MIILKKKLFLILVAILCVFFFTRKAYAMHISEGILPFNWAGLWYLIAAPFLIKGILDIKMKSKLTPSFKPLLGMMGALIFVISCMPVPVPTAGTCSHPAGTGISAILIGPIMSIFVTSIALFIQALFLAHGGITTWGADIVSMGVAGSFAGYIVFKILRRFKFPLFACGFAAGLLADWATYITTSFELASALHGSKSMFLLFWAVLTAFIPTQLPLGILEGFLTGGVIVFVYRRRPDILVSLGVVREDGKRAIKGGAKIFGILWLWLSEAKPWFFSLLISLFLFANSRLAFGFGYGFGQRRPNHGFLTYAEGSAKWGGVDESVVEKVAQEHGRPAWTPFINTDQGDLLLFVFLLAGAAGGFVMGYNFRGLFAEKNRIKDAQ